MAYDLIEISALPETTPDESQDIVIGDGDYAKRIKYGDVKADMVGTTPTYTTDTEPYLMRRTAHVGVVGKCALEKIVGGSLGWNQLCNGSSVTVPNGHKYYMKKSGTASIGASTGSAITGLTSGTDMVIGLTAMFGSTIADYVYGLESATAGSGIAWLSQYIDLGTYHAYDAGSIQSVQATAHVTKDANNNVIGNYPLGSDTLRGYPMLVNNKLAFDGDEKYPNGTTKRKYGIVDLGTLTYGYVSISGSERFYTSNLQRLIKVPSSASVLANIICAKYKAVTYNDYLTFIQDDIMTFSLDGTLIIRDTSYTDDAAFKTAMSGVYLVYPLTTETTESSTAFQKIQTIDKGGTEQFVCSSPVPVGHETQTPDNILAALEWLGE